MISQKLAEQLKKAGFPQKNEPSDDLKDRLFEGVYVPTLSELIKACEEEIDRVWEEYERDENKPMGIIFRLQSVERGWVAGNGSYSSILEPKGEGKTPEIAVAKLWLKLNEPKNKKPGFFTTKVKRTVKEYKDGDIVPSGSIYLNTRVEEGQTWNSSETCWHRFEAAYHSFLVKKQEKIDELKNKNRQ